MPAYDAVLFVPPAPLARVTLHNPANGKSLSDVPMLLDSGADVTLIPRECATPLDFSVDPGVEYELKGFDGNASVASVVHLRMEFLGCVFCGRFLLTDDSCGILGRNILNLLSIVFDGPHLTWRKESA